MKRRQKDELAGWIYILPSFIIILLFVIIPIIMSVYYSFTDYNVINPAVWVGFKNYFVMFKDIYVQESLKNTVYYTILTVPLQTIVSLVLAYIIAELFRNKFGNFIKGSLFVPVISSSILIGTIWVLILSTDNGILNSILAIFSIPPVNWLGQRSTSLLSVSIVSVWKNVGYFLVIFYAAILEIPRSYSEAAEIDGASKLQIFTKITIPCIKPIIFLVTTLGIIWSYQVFDLVYAMTQGGPGSSTITLVYTIYDAAFKQYRMGYASSISILLFALIILTTGIQKLFFKDKA